MGLYTETDVGPSRSAHLLMVRCMRSHLTGELCQCISLLSGKYGVIQRQRGLPILSRASTQLPRNYEPAHALGFPLPEAAGLLLHHWRPTRTCRARHEELSSLGVMHSVLTAHQLGQDNSQLF